MRTLGELLRGVDVVEVLGDAGVGVEAVHYNSRRVEPGSVFVAMRGEQTDGNLYVPQALEAGAVAVVSECVPPAWAAGTVWARVAEGRRALAAIAANFYGHPSSHIRLAGITGTNGKTTTSFLLESIFQAAGKTSGLFGTIEYHIAERVIPAPNTTPESLDLQRYLAELRQAGGTHAVMEVSSHALAMSRVHGCQFRAAVFTNLTRDHLDFHGTMEAYFDEKRKLFAGAGAPPPDWAVLNADDTWAMRLGGAGNPNVVTYGLSAGAQLRPVNPKAPPATGHFDVRTPWGLLELRSELIGRPNVYNLLAAAGAGLALGFSTEEVARGLSALRNVPGRFERVDAGQPFLVVVDYAHTDDALRNVIHTARAVIPRGARVITLFGCGGDRDRAKRPLMGEAAGSLSDLVILTSDNPRSEDPRAIIQDALPGIEKSGAAFKVEPDRAAAIVLALGEARPGDIVILAGKGHEDYQILGTQKIHFDDREAAMTALAALGYHRD